jgi:hypothetical protein
MKRWNQSSSTREVDGGGWLSTMGFDILMIRDAWQPSNLG